MVTVFCWARPWVIDVRFSLRVSIQRTARPIRLAAQPRTVASGSAPIFAPNPPPTSGAMTRTASSPTPRLPTSCDRAIWAFCVDSHAVSLPSSPHTHDAPRTSSGAGATRWLTIVCVTTASQLSKRASSNSSAPWTCMTLLPVSGYSSVSPASAASMVATASSGS